MKTGSNKKKVYLKKKDNNLDKIKKREFFDYSEK